MRWLSLLLISSFAAMGDGPARLVEELLPRVVKVMGLPGPKHVKVKVLSREQAEAMLRKDLEDDRDHLQRLGEALLAVGLLPEGTKLEALAPDFNRQNVNGFYDLRQHTLFLLDDQPDEAQRPIVAHELAHAVQDANVDLDAAMKARRSSEDATLAFTAVLEGQAQATAALVMDGWLRDQHVTVEGMAGLLSDTTAKSAAEAAERAPTPWLGLQLRFPYVAGRELIAANATADDPIARGLLNNPPASTAQVLGVSAGRGAAGDRPLTPALSPLEGRLQLDRLIPNAKPSISTTLGRAHLELLGAGLGEGWRGDRLESVRVGRQTIAAWVIVFETPQQSARVAAAMKNASSSGRVVLLLSGEQSPKVRAALLAREFR